MSIKSFVALVAVVALVGFSPASADSGRYDLASTPFVSVQSNDFLGLALGGYNFGIVSQVPVSVDVVDDSGEPVSFTVCQDVNDDGLCGDAGEATVSGCGTHLSLAGSAVPFVAGAETLVFIEMVQIGCGVATSGSVTLNFA